MTDDQMLAVFGSQDYYGENDWLDRVPKYREPYCGDPVQIDANGCVVGDQICVRQGVGGQQSLECTSAGQGCYSDEHIDLNPIRSTPNTPAIGPAGEMIGNAAGEIMGFVTSRSWDCYVSVGGVAIGVTIYATSFYTGSGAVLGTVVARGSAGYAAEACAFPAGGVPR